MAIEKVRNYFEQFDKTTNILEFDVSSATVELAAQSVGCEPARIAKSLSFRLKKSEQVVIVVTAGDARISNPKFREQFGEKPMMLPGDEVLSAIGHEVGGVCPFAVNEEVDVYLDISLKRFTTVYPACGSSNSAIELTLPEIEQYAKSQGWVDVCKNWQD